MTESDLTILQNTQRKWGISTTKFFQVSAPALVKYDWLFHREYTAKYQDSVNEQFYRDNVDIVDWYGASMGVKLSIDFIREFKERLDIPTLFIHQDMPDWLKRKFLTKQNKIMHTEAAKGFLTERFMIAHYDLLCWKTIAEYQDLDPNFIEQNIDLFVDNKAVGILEKFQNIGDIDGLYFHIDNQHQFSIQEKQDIAVKYFKLEGDSVIGYKKVLGNRRSSWKPTMVYKDGETVSDWHCNRNTSKGYPFGICVTTEENAQNFMKLGTVLKVKVKINDIGSVNSGIIKANRVTIIGEI
jgi:hypothetical protein